MTAAVGVTLSVIASREVSKFETRQALSDLQLEVASRAQRLKREVDRHLEVVLSLRGFFEASKTISREQFKAFVDSALQRHPDIQALEWIPRVPDEERLALEAAARKEGLTGYAISERGSRGELVPAAFRAEYFPVYYVEPLRGNEPAVGFDLASDPIRRQALEAARRTGEPYATAAVTLVQEQEQQKGFLVFAPVLESAAAPAAGADDLLQGFALGVFRIGTIVDREMLDSGRSAPGYDIALFDDSAIPSDQLVHRTALAQPGSGYADFVVSEPLGTVAGLSWRVEATPTMAYLASRRSGHGSMVLAVGLLLTLMMVSYLVVWARRAVEVNRLAVALRDANDELQRLVAQDPLTALPNRRRFSEALSQEWLRARRERSPLSLLMIDVDRFKNFNDRYGHPAGDECLQQLAEILRETVERSIDLVCRYGGEEFAVLLANTEASGARIVAERCRAAVEGLRIPHEDSDAGAFVTISVGLCSLVPARDATPEDLLSAADAALYAAKSAGRNRVSADGPSRVSASRTA